MSNPENANVAWAPVPNVGYSLKRIGDLYTESRQTAAAGPMPYAAPTPGGGTAAPGRGRREKRDPAGRMSRDSVARISARAGKTLNASLHLAPYFLARRRRR